MVAGMVTMMSLALTSLRCQEDLGNVTTAAQKLMTICAARVALAPMAENNPNPGNEVRPLRNSHGAEGLNSLWLLLVELRARLKCCKAKQASLDEFCSGKYKLY